MNIPETIRRVQSKLGVEVDGFAGPETWRAIAVAVGIGGEPLPVDPVDARSEKNIATLLPEVQPYARALVTLAAQQGITIKVTSGTRTYEEQAELYAQGRTKPGKVVTNARPGSSWHNHSVAFDVTIFDGAKPVYESPLYKVIGAIGQSLGLEWGGSWKSIVDEPHLQMTNGKSIAEAKRLHDQGSDVFA